MSDASVLARADAVHPADAGGVFFSSIIRGHLNLVSIPSNNQPVVTLDPGAFQIDMEEYEGFVHNNQNPEQSAHRHLQPRQA